MKRKIKYSNEPIGKLKVVKDFLPPFRKMKTLKVRWDKIFTLGRVQAKKLRIKEKDIEKLIGEYRRTQKNRAGILRHAKRASG